MLRRLAILVTLSLFLTAAFARLPALAHPGRGTLCNTTLLGLITGDVVVPAGATCVLGDHATPTEVTGSVRVGLGAFFQSNSLVTIGGDIRSRGYVHLFFTTLGGSLTNTIGGIQVEGSTIHGNIWAKGNVENVLILGPLTVDGNVWLTHNTASIVAANNSTIGGDVLLAGNTAGGQNAQVIGNFISGDVLVVRNVIPLIGGNEIDGHLACYRNDPDPTNGFLPNVVLGGAFGECIGL